MKVEYKTERKNVPDIWASVYYNGDFVLATRRFGAEADLGTALYEKSLNVNGVKGILLASLPFGIEAIVDKFAPDAKALKLDKVRIIPNEATFGGVTFKYDVKGSGLVDVTLLETEEREPKNIKEVFRELKIRRQKLEFETI